MAAFLDSTLSFPRSIVMFEPLEPLAEYPPLLLFWLLELMLFCGPGFLPICICCGPALVNAVPKLDEV